MIDLDELGPESAKSFPGQEAVDVSARPAQRATQEIDYGRRGKGYLFGAFQPATGDAFTQDYRQRTIVNWIDFLEQVDAWVPAEVERIYAILDNLNVHHADDVLLFCLTHPRWEFVFQPTYAAYLNLIEPWWKVLRSLAFKGRRLPDLGGARDRCTRGNGLLECPPASLRLGTSPPAPRPTASRHRPHAKGGLD